MTSIKCSEMDELINARMHIFFPCALMRLFSKSVSFCLIVSHFLKIRTLTEIQLSVLTTRSHVSHAHPLPRLIHFRTLELSNFRTSPPVSPLIFVVINSQPASLQPAGPCRLPSSLLCVSALKTFHCRLRLNARMHFFFPSDLGRSAGCRPLFSDLRPQPSVG